MIEQLQMMEQLLSKCLQSSMDTELGTDLQTISTSVPSIYTLSAVKIPSVQREAYRPISFCCS